MVLANWPLVPAKYVFKEVYRPPRAEDSIVTAFRDGEVTLRKNRRTTGFTNAIAEIGYHGIRIGDLVIHSMDGFAGAIGVSDSVGKASPVVHAYLSRGTDHRFYAHLLRAYAWSGYIESLSKGIRQRSTAFDQATFGALRLPLPVIETQTRIADFLDRETGRLDALMDKKRRLIELLEEKRTALISHAVEGSSADPTVKLGRFVDLLPGYAFPSSGFIHDGEGSTGIRLLRGVNVAPGTVRWDEMVRWLKTESGAFLQFQLKPGDLVLGMDRPWIGSGIRVARVTEQDVPSLLLQRVARLRSREGLDQDYLFMLLAGNQFLAYFEPILTGISVPHISPEQIMNFRFRLPTRRTQRRVVELVDRQTSVILSLIQRIDEQISKLGEYRQALITGAVTGQIDVSTFDADRMVEEVAG